MSLKDHKQALATEVLNHLGEPGILRSTDGTEKAINFRMYTDIERFSDTEVRIISRAIGLDDTLLATAGDIVVAEDNAKYKLLGHLDTSGGIKRFEVKMGD